VEALGRLKVAVVVTHVIMMVILVVSGVISSLGWGRVRVPMKRPGLDHVHDVVRQAAGTEINTAHATRKKYTHIIH
jgi:cytochrome c-type biogenesis protein CcmH/NrfG